MEGSISFISYGAVVEFAQRTEENEETPEVRIASPSSEILIPDLRQEQER
jgi:hypothetical protein